MVDLIRRSADHQSVDYDAFISYSHLEDDALAATLQAGLETFGSPWYRSRVSRVFRDMTDLAATPGLLSEITDALGTSRWFVLIASQQAAESPWVNEEVSWWLANKGHERFLIVLSEGEIRWGGHDFDWEHTTALPPSMARAFPEEPGWIDLRGIKDGLAKDSARSAGRPRRLTRYRARRQVGEWVAGLAAPIRGMSKGSLVGEHLRHRKRTRRLVQAVLAVMLTLSTAAVVAAAVAVNQLSAARLQNRIATSRELTALSETLLTRHLDLAELFAVEAYRLNPSGQSLAALFQAVSAGPHLVTYLVAGGTVTAVAGSADGRVVVAGRSDGTVLRWSLPDNRPTVITRMTRGVTGVSVNKNGSAIAAVSQAAALRWDRGRGVRMLRIPSGQRPIAASISASGRFAAVVSAPPQELPNHIKLAVYDLDARLLNVTKIASVTVGPQYLSFLGDSQVTTLGSAYGTWRRLSVPALRTLSQGNSTLGNEDAAALSPGGKFVGSSNDGELLTLLNITKQPTSAGGSEVEIRTHGAASSAVAVNPRGTLIARAADGFIYVSSIARNGTSSAPLTLPGNSVVNDGDLIFAGHDELISASGGLLTLWDLKQYSRIATETSFPAPQGCSACGGPIVSIRPGGGRVAVTTGGGSDVAVQDLTPDAQAELAISPSDSYATQAWTPDGKHLLMPTGDGGAEIWSAARKFTPVGKWSHTLSRKSVAGDSPNGSLMPIVAAFRPDGRTVVEVFPNGAIMVRDGTTGRVEESVAGPASLTAAAEPSFSAAVDAAGQWDAIVTPSGVVDTSITSKRTRVLPGESGDKVAFDGEQLLIQQPDGPLQVWNTDASRLVKTIAGPASTVAGPVAGRNGFIAETNSAGSVVVTDLDSGNTLGSLGLPAGIYLYSTGIGMPASGASLVTVTESSHNDSGGTLTDWRMSVDTWLRVACASAGHSLSDADWQEYVGGSPPAQLACSGEPSEVGV